MKKILNRPYGVKVLLSAPLITGALIAVLMAFGCQKGIDVEEPTSDEGTTEDVNFADPNVTPPTEMPAVQGPNVELPQE